MLYTAYSKMYLIRVLSFIGDLRFNARGEHVPFFLFFFFWGGGVRRGACWLPAGGICASQGTFSSIAVFRLS